MRKNLGGLILVLLLASLRASVWAQGLPLGSEFQVNTYTMGAQEFPAVATDPLGNFVVVWESGQDGSDFGVFGQRFASSGTPLGTEFQVNTYTTGYQGTYPSSDVATDGAGNFVVVWTSDLQDGSYYGVFGQRFSNTGARVGTEFQVNTYTTGNQNDPTVASTGAGNFVVLWQSANNQDGDARGIFGQRFSNTGTPLGGEFQVNTYTTGDQHAPAVALDAAGNFVVVWHSPQDGNSDGVFGQRFDSSGALVGTEFQVNTYTTNFQGYAAVGSDAAGNFVVVWESGGGQDGDSYGVFGQRFSNSGARVGTEFQVNTYTSGSQGGPAIAMDAAGNFVVAWRSASANQDGSGNGVFAQRFASGGARLGTEFQVNTYTTGNQGSSPESVAVSPLNFVVVWHASGEDGSSYGIFAQRFSPLVPSTPPAAEHVAPALGPASLILLGLGLVLFGSAVLVRKRRRV